MNDTAKKRAEADLALAALDERVARLEEGAGQRIADVEGISATNTAALVAGKAPDEKKLEAALEERDRAVRRLEAARVARAQAEEGSALAKGWLQRKRKPPVGGKNAHAGVPPRKPVRETFDMAKVGRAG